MSMTREDILKKILTECISKWQPELAEKYNVSQKQISHLLQDCGFIYRKFTNNTNGADDENSATVDIDLAVNTALKKQRVQEICDEILKKLP